MEEYDLLQCIDKALDSYGSSVKNAIFWKMTILRNSSRSDVLSDPHVLAQVIEETFGSSAGEIDSSIISEIDKKFNLSSNGVRSLVNAISEAKSQIIITCAPNCQLQIARQV